MSDARDSPQNTPQSSDAAAAATPPEAQTPTPGSDTSIPAGHLPASRATGAHVVPENADDPEPVKPAGVSRPNVGDGQQLLAGRYRLESLLGRGSMGAVWRAHDVILRRSVAVKEVILPPTQTREENEVARERALREARAIAALSHPNVVTLFDVVEDDGRPWVVMELVPAPSLAQIIHDRGPLGPTETARIGLAVLSALDAAHQVGITHRDVKPGNILVSDDGRIKLADFGISRKVDESQLTRTGLMVGSPSYIAPEVARGKEAGRPADIWGLGATMHCAVEGTPPFDLGDPVATLTAVVGDPPRPAPHAGPLGPILARTLIKDPRARIKTDELRDALASVASRPAPSRQPVPPPRRVPGPPPSSGPTGRRPPAPMDQAGTRVLNSGGTSIRPVPPPPQDPPMGAGIRTQHPASSTSRLPMPAHNRPASGPVTPSQAGPASGATGLYRPGSPSGPQHSVGTFKRRAKVIGATTAAVLVAAIIATVAIFVINRDDPTAKSDGNHSSSFGQSSSNSSSTSAPPAPTGAVINNGVATGSIVVNGAAVGFSFNIPDKWEVSTSDEGRAEFVDGKSSDKPAKQTKITVIADLLADGSTVVKTIEGKMSQEGSPAQLPGYSKVKFTATENDTVLWEYNNTLDGTLRKGYLYAAGNNGVVWQVIFTGPREKAAQLADVANGVKDSFQPS